MSDTDILECAVNRLIGCFCELPVKHMTQNLKDKDNPIAWNRLPSAVLVS